MIVTDSDLEEKLREIYFRLGAYEMAAAEHKDIPIGIVKDNIDRTWNSTLKGEQNE